MRRRLLNLLTVLSLLLCLAAATAWGRSYWFFEGYGWFDGTRGRYLQVSNLDGRLWITHAAPLPAGFRPTPGPFRVRAGGTPPGPSYLGFFADHSMPGQWTYAIPYWVIVLLTGVDTAAGIVRLVRAARRRPGTCLRCGYDLTGNVSGVCPECGVAASVTPSK